MAATQLPVTLEKPEPQLRLSDIESNFKQNLDRVKQPDGRLDIPVKEFNRELLRQHREQNFQRAYDTTGIIVGRCLIINNRCFERHDERIGTDIDRDNLANLFEVLRFRVTLMNNLTAQEMKDACREFILDESHADAQACVLALLTHGKEGYLYGSDSQAVLERLDILDNFNRCECRLRNKPKLIIVQACRTQLKTKMVTTQTQISTEAADTGQDKEFNLVEMLQRLNYDDGVRQAMEQIDCSDMLLAHSTLPGYASWRHKHRGSWFIQAIVTVFARECHSEHVADMFVEVNRVVTEAFGQGEKSQMPAPTVHLRKKFYFFPCDTDVGVDSCDLGQTGE